jgi:hypothetical protein
MYLGLRTDSISMAVPSNKKAAAVFDAISTGATNVKLGLPANSSPSLPKIKFKLHLIKLAMLIAIVKNKQLKIKFRSTLGFLMVVNPARFRCCSNKEHPPNMKQVAVLTFMLGIPGNMLCKSCRPKIQPKMTVTPIALTAILACLEKDWSAVIGFEGRCTRCALCKISNFLLP